MYGWHEFNECYDCRQMIATKETIMGLGYDNAGDDWEPTSMLEHHPDYYRDSGQEPDYWTVKANDDGYIQCLKRIRQWLFLLGSYEIISSKELDNRTLQWLQDNLNLAEKEFPSETKARLAKEAAAILKEAEQLEARAKQLREKAAQTKC